MGQPYVGEIRMFGGNFAPAGWMFCDGQTMPISENDTLFNLIGTTYGGDGQETFSLPDLQGRVPVHMGRARAGTPISSARRPGSRASPSPSSRSRSTTIRRRFEHPADVSRPGQRHHLASMARPASRRCPKTYAPYAPPIRCTSTMRSLSPTGGSQPHDNMQPYLVHQLHHLAVRVFPQQN